MKGDRYNGIKKDIVQNYQFSHVISSKAPFEGIMKRFTEFYSSGNKLFIVMIIKQLISLLMKKNLIYRTETSSLIINFPFILWINMEQITKLRKENISLFSNTIIKRKNSKIGSRRFLRNNYLKQQYSFKTIITGICTISHPSQKFNMTNGVSIMTNVVIFKNMNFMISHLLKLNRIPFFLIYYPVPEFEVPKIHLQPLW